MHDWPTAVGESGADKWTDAIVLNITPGSSRPAASYVLINIVELIYNK